MNFLLQALGGGVVLPAAIAFACITLATRLRRLPAEWSVLLGAAAALGMGFFAAYWALGMGALWPSEPQHWLPYLTLLAVTVGLIQVDWLLLLSALAAAYLLVPHWPRIAEARLTYQLSLVACILALGRLRPFARDRSGPFLPALFLIHVLLLSAFLALTGNNTLAHLGGALGGVLAGSAFAAWRLPGLSVAYALIPGYACLLSGLVLQGKLYHYGEAPTWSFVVMATAPLFLWLSRLPFVRKMPGPWPRVVETVLVLLPAAVALASASLADSGGWDEAGES